MKKLDKVSVLQVPLDSTSLMLTSPTADPSWLLALRFSNFLIFFGFSLQVRSTASVVLQSRCFPTRVLASRSNFVGIVARPSSLRDNSQSSESSEATMFVTGQRMDFNK